MKFALQKAVNIPVNAISAVSGAHLRDKLQRLLVLLSGQQVEITNSKISVQEHPAALPFCKYLFAKMVVVGIVWLKAQESFSDRPSSICSSACHLFVTYTFFYFFRTTWLILTKLTTIHPWEEGIQVCSSEGGHPSPRGANSKKNKIH
jgi:hypothetical protein